VNPLDLLRARWHRTLHEVGSRSQYHKGNRLFDEILGAYSQPHRHYHDWTHLASCFNVLDEYFPRLPGIGTVELALWFHDFVYDTHATDNEEKSAQFAEMKTQEVLGFDKPYAMLVASLVLATKHVAIPRTAEARNLIDVDLSILGEEPAIFDEYETKIRLEYEWVPEEAFKAGRAKALQGFLKRPLIFHHVELRRLGYEERARENMQRSLQKLGAPSD